MSEYAQLPVFGTPQDLPKAQTPTGPYLCDNKIKLSKQELLILSKDPKYSLLEEIDERNFKLELERMVAKNRFNEYNCGTSTSSESILHLGVMESDNVVPRPDSNGKSEAEGSNNYSTRVDSKSKWDMWQKESHRYI